MIRYWLLLSLWTLPAGAARAELAQEVSCAERVTAEAPPEIETGVSIPLNAHDPVSPAFSDSLRFPARVEDRAIAFAASRGGGTLSFKSSGATWVKFSPISSELVIVVSGRILFYEDLSQRRFDFERPKDVFYSLYRARVRGQKGIAHAEPFESFSRNRHFRNHGHEFGAPDEVAYEADALEFAQSPCGDCLTINFTESGQPRTFKADFATREVVILGRGQRLVTYYKNEGALNPYRKFFVNVMKRVEH